VRSHALANQERVLAAAVTAVLRDSFLDCVISHAGQQAFFLDGLAPRPLKERTPEAKPGSVRDEDLDFPERTRGSCSGTQWKQSAARRSPVMKAAPFGVPTPVIVS
jgi:hypothetical protein